MYSKGLWTNIATQKECEESENAVHSLVVFSSMSSNGNVSVYRNLRVCQYLVKSKEGHNIKRTEKLSISICGFHFIF